MTLTAQRSALMGTARHDVDAAPARQAILGHGERVGRLCESVALELGLTAEKGSRLQLAGELHDVGKRLVPEAILLKRGKLNAAEWDQIRRHPAVGAGLIAAAGLPDIAGWVLVHHERPDGLGYPLGLAGEQIAIEGRILAATDAFDAMTSERSYSPALDMGGAVEELDDGTGSQFDGEVVSALLRCLL